MSKNYRLITLYSGSKGNSVLFSAMGTSILIDAGKSTAALCSALKSVGSSVENISAVFVTHEHCDHISALDVLSKKYSIPIHIMDRSASVFDRRPDSYAHNVMIRHKELFSEQVGELKISAFRTPHDSLMSVGYRIEFEEDGKAYAVGIATDIGYVSNEVRCGLLGCDSVVLESNHDVDMLKNGRYPYELKKRILSSHGHLSNKDSAEFALCLAENGTREFIFAHLSEENNDPELALDEHCSALSGMDVRLAVACPDHPTEI